MAINVFKGGALRRQSDIMGMADAAASLVIIYGVVPASPVVFWMKDTINVSTADVAESFKEIRSDKPRKEGVLSFFIMAFGCGWLEANAAIGSQRDADQTESDPGVHGPGMSYEKRSQNATQGDAETHPTICQCCIGQ